MKRSLGARTMAGPAPVVVIGTYDAKDRPNVMTASWAGLCCSVPPCMAVALRKANYTYGNILHHKCFTINIPSQDDVAKADLLGMISGRQADKFAKAGLTPVAGTIVHAPYVKEFPLVLECRLVHTFELGLHTQFVGEILDVKADESILDQTGRTSLEKMKPCLFDPDTQRYFGIGECLGQAFSIGGRLF